MKRTTKATKRELDYVQTRDIRVIVNDLIALYPKTIAKYCDMAKLDEYLHRYVHREYKYDKSWELLKESGFIDFYARYERHRRKLELNDYGAINLVRAILETARQDAIEKPELLDEYRENKTLEIFTIGKIEDFVKSIEKEVRK